MGIVGSMHDPIEINQAFEVPEHKLMEYIAYLALGSEPAGRVSAHDRVSASHLAHNLYFP